MTSKPAPRRIAAVLQWNLSTLLLLTAAVAVWVGCLRYRQKTADLNRQVDMMLQLAADPEMQGDSHGILVRSLRHYWDDRLAWDIYLPDGDYAVRLADHGIKDQGIAPVCFESPLGGGWHRIELQTSDIRNLLRYVVLIDGANVNDVIQVTIESPFSSFDHVLQDGSQSSAKPVILFRHAFLWPGQDENETNGLLLWLERVQSTE